MASYSKSILTEPQGIASVAAGAVAISSVIDVSTKLGLSIGIDYAQVQTGAKVGIGTVFEIQVSMKSSGNDTWITYRRYETGLTDPASDPVDGTEAVGSTVIEETNLGTLAVGQKVFFKNSVDADSEWGEVISLVAATSFTLLDPLTKAQTGSTWYSQAERWVRPLDVTAFTRLRVVCKNNLGSTNKNIMWRVSAISADSVA